MRASDSRAVSRIATMASAKSPLPFVTLSDTAFEAESRTTVRIVPSTGFSTAASSDRAPSVSADATSPSDARALPSSPPENPSRNWESIMPQLPRAPSSADRAATAATRSTRRSRYPANSPATASRVRLRLVPVSPSATGKTLIRLSSALHSRPLRHAASSARRNRGPST